MHVYFKTNAPVVAIAQNMGRSSCKQHEHGLKIGAQNIVRYEKIWIGLARSEIISELGLKCLRWPLT